MVSKNRANAGGIRGSAVSNDYSGRYMSRQWLGGDRYGQFGDGICQPKPLPLVGYVSMGLFENAPDFSIGDATEHMHTPVILSPGRTCRLGN